MTYDPKSPLSHGAVAKVVEALAGTDIERLELQWRDQRLMVLRAPGAALPRTASPAAEDRPDGFAITAPLTGVFYARPSPEKSPFVEVGDVVARGQVIGLIETMKLFNEVTSGADGRVREVHAGEGDLVEAGRLLVTLDLSDGTG